MGFSLLLLSHCYGSTFIMSLISSDGQANFYFSFFQSLVKCVRANSWMSEKLHRQALQMPNSDWNQNSDTYFATSPISTLWDQTMITHIDPFMLVQYVWARGWNNCIKCIIHLPEVMPAALDQNKPLKWIGRSTPQPPSPTSSLSWATMTIQDPAHISSADNKDDPQILCAWKTDCYSNRLPQCSISFIH